MTGSEKAIETKSKQDRCGADPQSVMWKTNSGREDRGNNNSNR